MGAKLSELTMNELLVIQNTGVAAKNFIQFNDLFVAHIKPALEAKREIAKNDGDWAPNKSVDPNAILLFNAYNSGLRAGLRGIEAVCVGIVNRGVDAYNEIERRRKNEKQKAH